jgi:RHS repeat-associated protein
MQYSAHGVVNKVRLGNTLWEHTNFNLRLQPTQIGLGTAATNSSVMQLDFGYGSTDNNGNVQSQTMTLPALTLTQTYTYDPLNRLETANESSGSSWKQKFLYDRYGNRRIDSNTANTASDLIGPNPIFSATTNRIVAQAGEQYQYDGAGNLTTGRDGQTYAFDAENKMTSFNAGAATYHYDGDGKRVKKVVGSVTTVFVYDAMGLLLAEYTNGASDGVGTSYFTSDHLASPRVITDANAGVKARHDYHPFGEEVGLKGGRNADPLKYVTDTVRQKFTAKERDAETGLDYFGARYYGCTQGRFTSADPLLASGKPARPQTWNRYAYVLNNPLRLVDPEGLDGSNTEEQRRQERPPRIIYIFVATDQFGRTSEWTPDEDSARRGYRATTVPADNYADLQNNAPPGTQVKVITEGDPNFSPEGFINALGDSNAAAVIFAGHTHGETNQGGVYAVSSLYFGANGELPQDGTHIQVNAQNVALFGCDSAKLQSMFTFSRQSQGLIGMDGGEDNLSSTTWMGRAAYAAAGTFVRGGTPDEATRAANSRFQRFDSTAPRGSGSGPITVVNEMQRDRGDKAVNLR